MSVTEIMNGRWRVYQDPNPPANVIIGPRVFMSLDAGVVYAPYIPWAIIDRTDVWENEGGAILQ